MKYKYRTLKALAAAYKSGELSRDDILWIDNDDIHVYTGGYDDDDDNRQCVFRSDPCTALFEALGLLGIYAEGV